jgi:ferrous iron transport protein B
MVGRFDGKIGAFAYLLFVLLYMPRVAATAAIYHETNLRWTLFVAVWSTGLAYLAATFFYQAATFSRHPGSSLTWILLIAVIVAAVISVMSYLGQRTRREAE